MVGSELVCNHEQQPRAIGGHDGKNEEPSASVRFEADQRLDAYLWLQREMTHLPGQPAVGGDLYRCLSGQPLSEFAFDVADHRTVAVAITEVENNEGVQCAAVAGDMNAGVDDVVAGAAE